MFRNIALIFVVFFLTLAGFSEAKTLPEEAEDPQAQHYFNLLPLHQTKRAPGPYDWMTHHPEPFQSYSDFLRQNPEPPQKGKDVIYVQLIGDFDPARKKIVEQTVEYMQAFFGSTVKFLEPVPLDIIPPKARRVHPQTQDKQILSTYVIEEVLIPAVPDDAYSVIAFSSADLWPGQGWNFVFGQASIEDRVGVWSIYRNGDPNENPEAYQLALSRTIKTGTHELGHMFGMEHCQYYECLMNGSNHRLETDNRPEYLCPVDLRKFLTLTGQDASARFERLENISRKLGFDALADFYRDSRAKW